MKILKKISTNIKLSSAKKKILLHDLKKCTFNKAYLREKTPSSEDEIVKWVQGHFVNHGQATAYKMSL